MPHCFGNVVQLIQFVVRQERSRCRIVVAMLLAVSAVTSSPAVFAQFGGTLKDLEARLEEPTKKEIVSPLDGMLPKIAGTKQKPAPVAMTRWEVSPGVTLSVWTHGGEIHGINFVGKTSEQMAISLIRTMTNRDFKSSDAAKPKAIRWKLAPELMSAFAPVTETEQTILNKAVPPRIEQNDYLVTWYNKFTGEPLSSERVTEQKLINTEPVPVDVLKTWRRVISTGDQQRFVAVYDAFDWQIPNPDNPRVNLYKSSTIDSFMVLTTPLYLASNVRLGENLRGGGSVPSDYIKKAIREDSQKYVFYGISLRGAVDHPAVPWDWIDLKQVKSFELQQIVESDLGQLSLTAKMRRVEALARRDVLSKLVLPVISGLKDKKTQDEALACLMTTAKLLKQEPQEELGPDVKQWTKWYEELKKALPNKGLVRGPKAPIDSKSGKVPNALEGETLKVATKTAGKTQSQKMGSFTKDRWSGDGHLWWSGAKKGARLELELPVPTDGTFDIEIVMTMARDYGIVQLQLDGEPLGDPIDGFNDPDVITTGVLKLGAKSLTQGNHKLSLSITGSNPRAADGSLVVGLDYVRLVKKADGKSSSKAKSSSSKK